jgi:beta-1,4-mannosyl-glycoprotein beta-1,4-N-acetylglucosaminyltransferase
MKIIDCFLFFNELEMLSFRLKELNNFVDYFVLVESEYTFSGNTKELYYRNNKELFAEYNHKIIHVVEKDFDLILYYSAWEREASQRNAIKKGLDELNLSDDDVIIISDCDEIPNTIYLEQIKYQPKILVKPAQINVLKQDFYYYNLFSKKANKWLMSKVVSYQLIKYGCTPQTIRHTYDNIIENGGWHFSYFGSAEKIRTKIESFSHTEFNDEQFKNLNTIERNIELKKDLFFRSNEEIINCEINELELPKNYKMLLNI